MSIYYKYASDGPFFFKSYVDDCFIGIHLKLLENGLWRKEIPCELPGICTYFYVNQDFADKGPFRFSIP